MFFAAINNMKIYFGEINPIGVSFFPKTIILMTQIFKKWLNENNFNIFCQLCSVLQYIRWIGKSEKMNSLNTSENIFIFAKIVKFIKRRTYMHLLSYYCGVRHNCSHPINSKPY